MDFQQTLIASIVALVIGWSLSETGHRLRSRSEDKRKISRAISTLVSVYHEMSRIQRALELIKDRQGIDQEYERRRRYLFKKHGDLQKTTFNEFGETIGIVAEYLPFEAEKLVGLLKNFEVIGLSNLDLLAEKNPEGYIRALSVYEVGYYAALKALEKVITSLSLKVSLLTFWRAKKNLKRNKLGKGAKFVSFETQVPTEGFLNDVFDDFENNKSNTP